MNQSIIASPIIIECWAHHQVLRSLGFEASDIYVTVAVDAYTKKLLLFVILKVKVDDHIKELTLGIGPAKEDTLNTWQKACYQLNRAPAGGLAELWRGCRTNNEAYLQGIVSALRAKWIPIPLEKAAETLSQAVRQKLVN